MFKQKASLDTLQSKIRANLVGDKDFVPVRLKSNKSHPCHGDGILKLLCLIYQTLPAIIPLWKECDLSLVDGTESSHDSPSQGSDSIPSGSYSRRPISNTPPLSGPNIILDEYGGISSIVQDSGSRSSSQRTELISSQEIQNDLNLLLTRRQAALAALKLPFVTIGPLEPKENTSGISFLEDKEIFDKLVTRVSGIWNAFAATAVASFTSVEDLENLREGTDRITYEGHRFFIICVFLPTRRAVIVIDLFEREWIYLCPWNDMSNNPVGFEELRSIVASVCGNYPDLTG